MSARAPGAARVIETLRLVGAVSTTDLLRAAALRLARRLHPRPHSMAPIEPRDVDRAEASLARAPTLFGRADLREPYERHFPLELARARRRGERLLDGEGLLFGRWTGSGQSVPPDAVGAHDPKWSWERQRAGELVLLGAAAQLHPVLLDGARRRVHETLTRTFDEAAPGQGPLSEAPLEVALRALHWLGALDLVGGVGWLPRAVVRRLAAHLLGEAWLLEHRAEDDGLCPANHLLGARVGSLVLALALGQTRDLPALRTRLLAEADRQILSDGAHFEASTGYHRFATELLLAALRAARLRELPLPLGGVVVRMCRLLAETLLPSGEELGIGDSDDARVLAVAPGAGRFHADLLGVGCTLFGDPRQKPPWLALPEEALWVVGPEAIERFARLPSTALPRRSHYPQAGLQLLRGDTRCVAMRAGSTGQRGVGGHGHNDALSIVIWDGSPLVVDPGTGSYTGDRLLRDALRSAALHSTLVVDGQEPNPLLESRPFALPDRARASARSCGEEPRSRLGRPRSPWHAAGGDCERAADGRLNAVVRRVGAQGLDRTALPAHSAEHRGFAGLIVRRTIALDDPRGLLYIDDELLPVRRSRRVLSLQARFVLARPARLGAGEQLRARLDAAGLPTDGAARVVELEGGAGLWVRLPRGCALHLEEGPRSFGYGTVDSGPLVTLRGVVTAPLGLSWIWLLGPGAQDGSPAPRPLVPLDP